MGWNGMILNAQDSFSIPRGRPYLDANRTTFVADNGQPLRGPFTSTEWREPPAFESFLAIKEKGLNAVHLYAEVFNLEYPEAGSRSPGYAIDNIDKVVEMTREAGLYLIITIGNGGNNGNHNYEYALDFWELYAPRYANETHVIYEVHNEPVAWGPPYLSSSNPAGAIDLEVDAYKLIRELAPETPVLLFTYAVFVDAENALLDINEFNDRVGNSAEIWKNAAVAFHGYGGWVDTAPAVKGLLEEGYPVFMTEFADWVWGGIEGADVEMTSFLEQEKISWVNFLHIPPYDFAPNIMDDQAFQSLFDQSGISWIPDYGNWPIRREVFGNGTKPRETPGIDLSNQMITGALRIQAEDFDNGGQQVSYYDVDLVNQGGLYREFEAVDITLSSDEEGGYAIDNIEAGEWLQYTILVNEPGIYKLTMRYSTVNEGCKARVAFMGAYKTDEVVLPSTGSFDSWNSVTEEIFLEYGQSLLVIDIIEGGFNLNWIELSPVDAGPFPDGIYKVINRNSGKAMTYEVATDGVYVVQDTYTGDSEQLWNFKHVGAGNYKVTLESNGRSWNVFGSIAGVISGSPLKIVHWWDIVNKHQRYLFRPYENGFYNVKPGDKGYSLGVHNGSTLDGEQIDQFKSDDGSSNMQWAVLAPQDVSIPVDLELQQVSVSEIQLTWASVADATHYEVMRSTSSGGPYVTVASNVQNTSFADAGLDEQLNYYYVVHAVGASGAGLASREVDLVRMGAILEFDEGEGNIADDSTGHGWQGTFHSGASWGIGINGSAVSLDGEDDYLSLPKGVVAGLEEATISTWVNLESANVWSRIFDFGTGSSSYIFMTPNNGWDGNLRVGIKSEDSDEERIDASFQLPTGVWTHVAFTIKGSVGILYVDGVEVGRNETLTQSLKDLGDTSLNYIGKSQWPDPYLQGRVDNFRIITRALSPEEIALQYSQETP